MASVMNLAYLPRRLGIIFVLQIIACTYATLAVGAAVKMRNIVGAEHFRPISGLSILIKDFGWLLWLLPAWWFFYHVREWQKDGADWALLGKVVISGVAVFLLIAFCGLMGSAGAMIWPLIVASPD
jgi:hypothetical protein